MSKANNSLIHLPVEQLPQANWVSVGQEPSMVLNTQQVHRLEEIAFEHIDSFLFMQAAGLRSAQKITEILSSNPHQIERILVLAGPGNNGGDACIVASKLHQQGFQVELWVFHPKKGFGTPDRNDARTQCRTANLEEKAWGDAPFTITENTLIIDGLLGIGCQSAPTGTLQTVIQTINTQREQLPKKPPVSLIALDCPSGLNCDTGFAEGDALSADLTLTYLACKTGLLSNMGPDLCGDILIEDLGCNALLEHLTRSNTLGPVAHTTNQNQQIKRLPVRQHQHHKGHFGNIGVIGGQTGMQGAALLSARTALQLGAGRVALSFLTTDNPQSLDPLFPELMGKSLLENIHFSNTLAIGPGLGQTPEAKACLLNVLNTPERTYNMVWDADALNLLAIEPELALALQHHRAQHPEQALILTPHPLEAARLLNHPVEHIQNNRIQSAMEISKRFQCTTVLKGSGTIIAQQSTQRIEINPTGGPALSTAGSGDVLTGAIAAMLGQGLEEFEAAACSVWLHGKSIEALPSEPENLLISHASEISCRMKQHLNTLLHRK
jgi:hydroxyethylthiazole kinase-like uncharacterized protein yjeF